MSTSAAPRRRAARLGRYATTSVVATTTSLLVLTALVGSHVTAFVDGRDDRAGMTAG